MMDKTSLQKCDTPVLWSDVLSDFIDLNLHGDFRSFPMNKKYIHMNVILPSFMPSKQHLAIVIDQSTSISTHVLEQFSSEIEAIRLDIETLIITLLVVDKEGIAYRTFVYGEPLDFDTINEIEDSYESAFDFIEEEALDIAAMLYVRGEFETTFDDEPEYPVMWVLSDDIDLPFGEKIVIGEAVDD
jgi:predicted metal-dependent peptidase